MKYIYSTHMSMYVSFCVRSLRSCGSSAPTMQQPFAGLGSQHGNGESLGIHWERFWENHSMDMKTIALTYFIDLHRGFNQPPFND